MDKTVSSAFTCASPTVVKDICIDENVQMPEKIVVEYDKADQTIVVSNDGSTAQKEETNEEDEEKKSPEEKAGLGSFIVTGYPVAHCYSDAGNQDMTSKLDAVMKVEEEEEGDWTAVADKAKKKELMYAAAADGSSDDLINDGTISARSSFSLFNGESNLLGNNANLFSSITASGHNTIIPYSGSISLRSEASTASAQSFAFPVLQPEWSSSPVRMVKAERRHLRKHRLWTALTCCKF